MKAGRALSSVIIAAALAAPASLAQAQMASSNFMVPSDALSGGGGDSSASANYGVKDTYGQSAAGGSAGADFGVQQGYRTRSGGLLDVSFVDGNGSAIAAPSVSLQATAGSAANGALGSADSLIRVTNTRGVAPWSLTIAATDGPTAAWTAGSFSLEYNGASGALSVSPASASVSPGPGCSAAGLAAGPAAAFNRGIVDAITLFTADGSAQADCDWDISGISLSQTVPASQPSASYHISMTITVS